MNKNLSKCANMLGKFRLMPILGGLMVTLSLLKDKKRDDEKPLGFFDKTAIFIKNNVGKLVFASYIPMLAEEGLASIRGQKVAKKLLSPDVYKNVVKGNALGFSTYLLVAISASLGATFATKVRDKIVHKNQN